MHDAYSACRMCILQLVVQKGRQGSKGELREDFQEHVTLTVTTAIRGLY